MKSKSNPKLKLKSKPELKLKARPPRKSKIKKIALFTAGFLLIFTAALFGSFYFLTKAAMTPQQTESVFVLDSDESAGGSQKEVRLEIRSGESARSVGARLEEAGLIKSVLVWQIVCFINPQYIKAGTYQFKSGLNIFELHQVFVSGAQLLVQLTIPEGSTIKKIAAALEKAGVSEAAAFIEAARDKDLLAKHKIPAESFEGYLFPDTYYFNLNYPAESVIEMMTAAFFKRLAEIGVDVSDFSAAELHDKVILASIVEREYRVAEEAPIMAGVFLNRLKKRMRLESCATVVYVLTEIYGKAHPTRLFYSDLEVPSPYNSYLHGGLPPGPISSPGALALKAAFSPKASEYLFFRVADSSSGKHYFSKSFDAHIKAGALLVK